MPSKEWIAPIELTRADKCESSDHQRPVPRDIGNKLASIQVVDFFSGCGGTSEGLRQAGMNIVAAIDQDLNAAATFESNFPEAHFIPRDIRQVQPADLKPHLGPRPEQPLLFSACAPCQPFSKQNRRRDQTDTRASLLDEIHEFVRHFFPEYIFLENVPGVDNVDSPSGPIGRLLHLIRKLGYHEKFKVLNFLHYGVPQTRRRFVMIASRIGPIDLPTPTHGCRKGDVPYSTVRQWIGDLPTIPAGGTSKEFPNHCSARLSVLNLKRIRRTPEGGDRRDWPKELVLPCHKGHQGHTDVYGRLSWDRPACTLTTRCVSFSNGRFGHPSQDRALTVREAACLQTFPRTFVFRGSLASMAAQVGNAVPVLIAQKFGAAINCHRESHDRQGSG